ncbi:MAG: GGDEF domain-containing protein [Oscillospiraceae bacterium]
MKKILECSFHRKILITLSAMAALIILSCIISAQISRLEENSCWDVLHQYVSHTSSEIESQIYNDQELLESIANIISDQDDIGSAEVQKIIDGFKPNTLTVHIGLLLPGDRVMLPNKPVGGTNGVLSFEEEAALGRHVSDKSVSISNKNKPVIRNFVPVVKNGETVAMLYGVVDLSLLPDAIDCSAYDGQAAVYVVDSKTGDFLVDTWHKSLGNITDLGNRRAKRGYDHDELLNDMYQGKAGHCIFESETTGSYLYFFYEPMSVNSWMIGLSVSEGMAFGKMKKVNGLLIGFIAGEILILGIYFVYILKSTGKELDEKQKLAERDLLTGLLNRNSYERNLYRYADSCEDALTCIYMDVNGLHELNNTKGHAEGDKMLRTVADAVHDRFGDRDAYRIGGDEFVAFVRDGEHEQIGRMISEINDEMAEHGYHVSIGVCRCEKPIDTDSLIKSAESIMYDEKKRYYEQKGEDMRSR